MLLTHPLTPLFLVCSFSFFRGHFSHFLKKAFPDFSKSNLPIEWFHGTYTSFLYNFAWLVFIWLMSPLTTRLNSHRHRKRLAPILLPMGFSASSTFPGMWRECNNYLLSVTMGKILFLKKLLLCFTHNWVYCNKILTFTTSDFFLGFHYVATID